MKSKIKVMNKRHEISDEELEGFKNFDALLAKHNTTVSTNRWMKVGAGAISILMVAGAIYYFTSASEPTSAYTPVKIPDIQLKQSESIVLLDTQEALNLRKKSESKIKSVESTENQFEKEKEERLVEVAPPVYVQAEPVDGYAMLYEYFNRELVYPSEAVADSVQGVLTISFTINKQGTAENFQFASSLGKLFEEEAIRLIQQMPAWKPATVNGTPVSSRMSLPLTFQIQKKIN